MSSVTLTQELIDQARACKSEEELAQLIKSKGLSADETTVKQYFLLASANDEALHESELEQVSGGGCGPKGDTVVSALHSCEHYKAIYEGAGDICHMCVYCRYYKGLWLCYYHRHQD